MFSKPHGAMYGGYVLVLIGIFLVLQESVMTSSRTHHSNRKVADAPPSKAQLGQGGWTLIHTMAANYPEKPSESNMKHARAFFRSLGALYPCTLCRDHFDRYVAVRPPDVSSRQRLLVWTCEAHNEVNRRNGKPIFPCTVKDLDKRWGDCGCN